MEVKQEQESRRPASREGLFHALFPELCVPAAARGTALLLDVLVFGLATLLARTHLAFGMYPFALAFLAARRQRVVPAAAGTILGALSSGPTGSAFAIAAALLLLIRVGLSYPAPRRVIFPVTERLFGEERPLRVLAAALTGAALGGYELLYSGPQPHALYFAAAAILSPTLLTALLAPIYDTPITINDVLGRGEGALHPFGEVRPAVAEGAILSLLTVLAYALSPLSLFGLDLAPLYATAISLFVARRTTAARAAVLGLALGLVSSVSTGVAMAALGLAGGFLLPYSALCGVLGGLLAGVAAASWLGGLSGFLATAPEASLGALLVFPLLSQIGREEDPAIRELDRRALEEAVTDAVRAGTDEGERLSRLGQAFSELSGMFFRLSDEERRPRTAEYLVECEKVCARHCATCSNRVRCWEQGERVAERTVYALAARLREAGKITAEDLPPDLRSGCPRIELILDEIRDECATMSMRRYRGDRNEFLSHDYAMLAKLLSDAARCDRAEECEDRDARTAWQTALGADGEGLALAVLGTRRKRLAAGGDKDTLTRRGEVLHTTAEAAIGCRLTRPEAMTVGNQATLRMQTARRFACEVAEAAVPREGSGVSGDVLRFFEVPDEYFYALLSDGMGSGEGAAGAAGVSAAFLETMLRAGTSRKTALRMLNDLVRTGAEECSATVDMLIFDLLYGHATFIKSGAAPSYIKRGGEILRVRSRTMPLGLCKTVDAERINVEVQPDDILILLSDGLAPDNEDPAWLLSLLATERTDDLSALATRIIAEAVSRADGPFDDMTVGLVRIMHAPNDEDVT